MPLIPDYFVYGSMFYLSFMGVWCSRRKIFIDSAHFLLFVPQAVMYLLFDMLEISPIDRAAYVRLSLFLIPLAFSIVLTIKYWSRYE